jgi:hypothetical protein
MLWPGLTLLGGMLLMFFSLQLARGVERVSGTMRRLLHGFNAVLASFFLLAILALINVLAYLPLRVSLFGQTSNINVFARTYDWTSDELHSIHPSLRHFVSQIEEPVKVYMIMPRLDLVTENTRSMLKQCREANPRFKWEALSPDANRDEVAKLGQKYALPGRPQGLLILYGSGDKPLNDFIKFEDMFSVTGGSRFGQPSEEPEHFVFKGQNALYNSLRYLSEGKAEVKVYVTQGHGEIPLEAAGARLQGEDLSEWKRRLENINHKVEPLVLEPIDKDKADALQVPGDADVIVVARPIVDLNKADPQLLPALNDFVKGKHGKKGKLVVLMDVIPEAGGKGMARTGVESFLQRFNVRLGNDRIISLMSESPLRIEATTNPDLAYPRGMASPNPVARTFYPTPMGVQATIFRFDDVRTVQPAAGAGQGASVVNNLVVTDPRVIIRPRGGLLGGQRYPFWAETDLARDPFALRREIRQTEDPQKLFSLLSKEPLPLAVVVSEPRTDVPAGHGSVEGKPQMVVFGDIDWITSGELIGQAGSDNFSLFSSCLSWLRERKATGKEIPDPERTQYKLDLPATSISRVAHLPAILMWLAVIVLGCGVWIVRRR